MAGMVKRIDSQHFAIAVQWKRKVYAAVYRHEALSPNPMVGHPAIRLTKLDTSGLDSRTYDLIRRCFRERWFWVCECWQFTRCGTCKHTDAAEALGLATK